MTKGDFLKWIDRFRHMGTIREQVEKFKYSDAELDALKDQLETNGKLFMKEKWKRRLTWG